MEVIDITNIDNGSIEVNYITPRNTVSTRLYVDNYNELIKDNLILRIEENKMKKFTVTEKFAKINEDFELEKGDVIYLKEGTQTIATAFQQMVIDYYKETQNLSDNDLDVFKTANTWKEFMGIIQDISNVSEKEADDILYQALRALQKR